MSDSERDAPDDVRGGLASRAFLAYLLTQFLGAMNDNMFRWIVVPLAKSAVAEEYQAWVLTAGSVFLILPFILFASYAGYLADRFSKRQIAGREIGHQGQTANAHNVIGGDRRQQIIRIEAVDTTDGDRMGRMKMHDRPGPRSLLIHGPVQEGFLGRLVAGHMISRIVQFRQPRRIQSAAASRPASSSSSNPT